MHSSCEEPTGAKLKRGKKITPELHKVIWLAYRHAQKTDGKPTTQEVWDTLAADPKMFDPKNYYCRGWMS